MPGKRLSELNSLLIKHWMLFSGPQIGSQRLPARSFPLLSSLSGKAHTLSTITGRDLEELTLGVTGHLQNLPQHKSIIVCPVYLNSFHSLGDFAQGNLQLKLIEQNVKLLAFGWGCKQRTGTGCDWGCFHRATDTECVFREYLL